LKVASTGAIVSRFCSRMAMNYFLWLILFL
jgi:hypothetical protein